MTINPPQHMQEQLPVLLVDNSNTRTKFALSAGNFALPGAVRCLPTRDLTPSAIRCLLNGWRFGRVCISSVSAQSRPALEAAFPGMHIRWVDTALGGSLFEQYEGAATLGADRVANVLAAVEYGRFPVVAVDMGTAATFDVVVHGPRFLGGVIAPGLQMLADSLHAHTSLLPRVPAGSGAQGCIGTNTVAAVQIGARFAFVGTVRAALRAIAEQLGTRPFAVATGGDAHAIVSLVPELDVADECLTLRGIALAAELAL